MGSILSLDLGKFKTVACWYDIGSGDARFQTTLSNRAELRELITVQAVDLIVFEACALAGWVFDRCRDLKVKAQVANTNGEAWKWKNVKRKTDKDDALKLAKLAALGQLPEVTAAGQDGASSVEPNSATFSALWGERLREQKAVFRQR